MIWLAEDPSKGKCANKLLPLASLPEFMALTYHWDPSLTKSTLGKIVPEVSPRKIWFWLLDRSPRRPKILQPSTRKLGCDDWGLWRIRTTQWLSWRTKKQDRPATTLSLSISRKRWSTTPLHRRCFLLCQIETRDRHGTIQRLVENKSTGPKTHRRLLGRRTKIHQ